MQRGGGSERREGEGERGRERSERVKRGGEGREGERERERGKREVRG